MKRIPSATITMTATALLALCAGAARADTVVQIPLPGVLDTRGSFTLTNGAIVPFTLAFDSPLRQEVEVALPLLEAVELQALEEGVPVDARLERGRSLRDALRRLWDVETFDRILLPVSADERAGFEERDVAWILMNAPAETLALRPASGSVRPAAPKLRVRE